MIYRVIGVNSDIAKSGLAMSFIEFTETGGNWNYAIVNTGLSIYSAEWKAKIEHAANCTVLEYHLLHASFGQWIGEQVNLFINEHGLDHRVHLVASNGHTVFHLPGQGMATRLGHGAFIAAETKLPVVTDLLSLDIAFGGKGTPIAAIGEKLLPQEEKSEGHQDTLIIALMGVLRWREEATMLSSLTGARQNSIGGALWLGTEA